MSIVTQCPGCGTRFRVTPPQLQAQHGMVRCGRCANVFDGFKTLATLEDTSADDPGVTNPKLPRYEKAEEESAAGISPAAAAIEPAPEPPVSPARESQPAATVVDESADDVAVAASSSDTSSAVPPPAVDEPAADVPVAASSPDTGEAGRVVDEVVSATPALDPPGINAPSSLEVEAVPLAVSSFDGRAESATPDEAAHGNEAVTGTVEPAPFKSEEIIGERPSDELLAAMAMPPKRRSAGWIFGALLLLIGLAAQGAYYYRSDIAANVPEARPHLNQMCELLHCVVALPQRPRQITIEASDMQATDPANPGAIALTATLRNHASTALGYPALDVVLTNTKEHTVARRIFLPRDYLSPGKDVRGGIAANAEITIRLDLETGDLGAAGFRLDLIAAPPG